MGCDKKGRIFPANETFSTELIKLTRQKIIIISNKIIKKRAASFYSFVLR